MDGSGDAASLGVLYAVPWSVNRIVDHDATKRLFAEFPTQLVGNFGEDGAPDDAEHGRVRRRKESVRNATGETDTTAVSAVAKVHNNADNARPHGIGDGYTVEHRKSIVPEGAPGSFSFAEHVMGIGAENCAPTPRRAHIWPVTAASKTVSESNCRTGANAPEWG
jgi:hypothetical protein